MTSPITSRTEALAQDTADPLAAARAAFVLPSDLIYLDGHSLGPASGAALAGVEATANEAWAMRLIRSWNDAGDGRGWIDLPARVGARIARLLGVPPETVLVCDSVSVNLFKLAAAALPSAASQTLIVETDEFPTDQYILEGLTELQGARLVRANSGAGGDALARIGGVLVKSVVNYRSAQIADVAAHEATARASGGLIVWDLSHAAGVVDLKLARDGARLAAGCTYKYLNGGPGAPAYVYVADDLVAELRSPLSGWMGHAAPFDFDGAYRPADGVARFASGTPAVLSLAALDGALDVFGTVETSALHEKARRLGDLCIARAEAMGLDVASPGYGEARGGHVGVRHGNGYEIVQALAARGVIADFRAPDLMRFGFGPLYVRYVDAWDAMDALEDIVKTRAWDDDVFRRRALVT